MLELPESFLNTVKFSGSPPTNTPVFSPITVLPLEAEALPGVRQAQEKTKALD